MLPPLPELAEVHNRLQLIFPPGTPQRGYVTREMAARTVFVLLYIGAIEDTGIWMAPKHVYRMGGHQAARRTDDDRRLYASAVERPGFPAPADRWFQDNTREPIRDETLREGLVRVGAVITRRGLPTTSSKGRYALQRDLALLFDPRLEGEALQGAIESWQDRYLSAGGLARVRLQQRSAAASKSKVLVQLPNGESRHMEPGPSSIITKAVVEVFGARYLADPAVLWISESGNRIVLHDDALARGLGLMIAGDRILPDVILVDLAPTEPLIVFVEVVATDGPVTEARRAALLDLVVGAGFKPAQTAFVTAFQDRSHPAFRKAIADLAWGSFAWCLSEAEHLIAFDGFRAGGAGKLAEFCR
jgi:hypothetical protein